MGCFIRTKQNQLPNGLVATQSMRTTGVNDTFSSTAESISQPTLRYPCHWAHVIVENKGFLKLTLTCSVDCWRVLQSRGQGPPRKRKQTYKGQGSQGREQRPWRPQHGMGWEELYSHTPQFFNYLFNARET